MIRMHHLFKYYNSGNPALEDINVQIAKGSFSFLTGPSGAGKSTFLKLIYAAEMPSTGQVLVSGRNVEKLRQSSIPYLRRNIGVVFQDFKLLPGRTVFDNVAITLDVLGLPRQKIHSRVMTMLTAVGMQLRLQSHPLELSGGEQQRVAIARALVGDPAILLADEPTGNLDPGMTNDIFELLKQFNLRGTTVLVATHDQQLISRFEAPVYRLDRGRLKTSGV
jgi:cell division transport system ATP-binding protein